MSSKEQIGEEKLSRAVVQLLSGYRNYAILLMHLNQVIDTELKGPAGPARAAVNLRNLYWNPVMAADLPMARVRGTLIHEAFHLILQHIGRLKGRDPKLWNYVADMKCNQYAMEVSDSRFSLDISDGIHCADDEDRRMTTEELYKKYKEEGEDGSSGGAAQWDAPITGDDSKQGDQSRPNDLDVQIWQNRIRDFAEKNQGKLPGGLQRELDGLLNPEIPWTELLNEYASEAITGLTDFTWKRFNRMWRAHDFYLPGMTGNKVNVFVAVDTSGSMGQEDLRKCFSEAKAILERHGDIHYMSCDAALHGSGRVDSIEEAMKLTKGGGGTDFRPVFKAVDEMYYHEETPPVLVYFTDGYGAFPEYEPPYPTIWVMIHSDVEAPFGKVVQVKHKGREPY